MGLRLSGHYYRIFTNFHQITCSSTHGSKELNDSSSTIDLWMPPKTACPVQVERKVLEESMKTDISYDAAIYSIGPGLDLGDLKLKEDWNGRPASKWAIQKIGQLQAKIDRYSYGIYQSKRYVRRDLSSLIPGHILRQYTNEAFGFDGWKMDLQILDVRETLRAGNPVKYTVSSEAQVKISLKDGTNTGAIGLGCCTMASKGESYNKSKKDAVSVAFKRAILSFEQLILTHEARVQSSYYVDGLFSSKIKREGS